MKWHREPEAELTDLRTLTSQSPVKAEVLGNRNWVNKGDWMEERRKEQRGIGRWRGSVNWRERRECERDTEKKIIRAKIKQIRETKTQAHPSLELPPASTCSPVVPFCRGSCTWKKKTFNQNVFHPFLPEPNWVILSYLRLKSPQLEYAVSEKAASVYRFLHAWNKAVGPPPADICFLTFLEQQIWLLLKLPPLEVSAPPTHTPHRTCMDITSWEMQWPSPTGQCLQDNPACSSMNSLHRKWSLVHGTHCECSEMTEQTCFLNPQHQYIFISLPLLLLIIAIIIKITGPFTERRAMDNAFCVLTVSPNIISSFCGPSATKRFGAKKKKIVLHYSILCSDKIFPFPRLRGTRIQAFSSSRTN